jgi:predicted ribosome quality control (RQC) complex YloA/Tae2 family protein
MAEALLINAGRVKMGLTSVQLPDPYEAGNTLTIPLDRAKSPQTNANDLFGSARRLQRGLEEVRLKRADLEDKIRTVQKALQALVERKDMGPAAKVLKGEDLDPAKKGRRSGAAHRGPGRRYIVEGFTILVGRSSTDNEKVTFRAAGPNDLWLHARDYPGSHVVVITEKKQVPDKVLYTAGSLAAEGSGARNETAPEIMVTERKWVRKLKGGKPGQVTVERYRTIRPRRGSR